jgi:hypothetical protein
LEIGATTEFPADYCHASLRRVFKLQVTSILPHSSWTLSEVQVRAAVAVIEQDEVA